MRYKIFIHAAAAFVSVVFLAPLAWLVIASVSELRDLLARPLRWLPAHPTWSRYDAIAHSGGSDVAGMFRQSMGNSVVVALGTVAVSMVVGVLGGYALARLRFRFRRSTMVAFLIAYMLPPIALLIPLYLVLTQLQLLDSKLGLIVVYTSFTTPFVLWIMTNQFLALPVELEEAARVDGCSRLGALVRVVLPVARPGLFATMMFTFLMSWDEFLYALIFTATPDAKTVPVAIAEFTGRYSADFGLVAAGGVLATLPPVLLALAFQRYVVDGLAAASVKG
ncbi:carbohydrate ABC transporter permease [Longispora urticae]